MPQTGLIWSKQVHYRETQDRYGELTTPSVLANCMIWVEKVSCLAFASLGAGLCKPCSCAACCWQASVAGRMPCPAMSLSPSNAVNPALHYIQQHTVNALCNRVQESGRRHKLLMLPPSATNAQVWPARGFAATTLDC